MLDELINEAGCLRDDDRKLLMSLQQLIQNVQASEDSSKVLIFTKDRTIHSYLKEALRTKFRYGSVELFNGSMPHAMRREAISRFEEQAQFLIVTEAGGGENNPQQKCHIMMNYDLPCYSMRLVQRIGRLYRYGQQKRVVVFNVNSP